MLRTSKVELRSAKGDPMPQFRSIEHRETFSDPICQLRVDFDPLLQDVKKYQAALQKGELVGMRVDGKPQAAMMIETLETKVSKSGAVSFSIDAVTPLKLLYESSADVELSKSLQNDAPIIDIIADAVKPYGIGEVVATADVATIHAKTGQNPGATATDINGLTIREAQVQQGETTYQFIARILTRLGLMLRMDAVFGSVYITAPHYDGKPLYTFTLGAEGKVPVGDRFVGDITIRDTNGGQWASCTVDGVSMDDDGMPMATQPKGTAVSADLQSHRPPFRATGSIKYKPKFVRDTNCRDADRCKNVAELTLGLAAEKAFVLHGTVHGFASQVDGTVFAIDTLARVVIEPIGFDEVMWVSERTFKQDKASGQLTELVFLPPNYFTLGALSKKKGKAPIFGLSSGR